MGNQPTKKAWGLLDKSTRELSGDTYASRIDARNCKADNETVVRVFVGQVV